MATFRGLVVEQSMAKLNTLCSYKLLRHLPAEKLPKYDRYFLSEESYIHLCDLLFLQGKKINIQCLSKSAAGK